MRPKRPANATLRVSAPTSGFIAHRIAAKTAPTTNTSKAARTRIAAQRRALTSSCSTGIPVNAPYCDMAGSYHLSRTYLSRRSPSRRSAAVAVEFVEVAANRMPPMASAEDVVELIGLAQVGEGSHGMPYGDRSREDRGRVLARRVVAEGEEFRRTRRGLCPVGPWCLGSVRAPRAVVPFRCSPSSGGPGCFVVIRARIRRVRRRYRTGRRRRPGDHRGHR